MFAFLLTEVVEMKSFWHDIQFAPNFKLQNHAEWGSITQMDLFCV